MEYSIYNNQEDSITVQSIIQAVLWNNKGNYSDPPWITICIIAMSNGKWAVPIPADEAKGRVKTAMDIIVVLNPQKIIITNPGGGSIQGDRAASLDGI